MFNHVIHTITSYLDSHGQVNEITLSFIDLVHKMEDLLTHFDFTIEVLESETEENVTKIKKRFSGIERQYEKIKIKEDLTVQQGKDVLLVLYERVFLKFGRSIEKCFGRDRHGDLVFENPLENLALIKITVSLFFAF